MKIYSHAPVRQDGWRGNISFANVVTKINNVWNWLVFKHDLELKRVLSLAV